MRILSFSLVLLLGLHSAVAAEKMQKSSVKKTSSKSAETNDEVVAELLRKPLTTESAVRIALLNNRSLQATLEDTGLSEADLAEARRMVNPEIDLAVKFPDRAPRGTMLEWTVAQDFLDLLLIPLRASIARSQLAGVRAEVADSVVQTVAEVKVAFVQVQADALIETKLAAVRDAQKASLEFSQKLHEAGNITDLALLREQVAYSDSLLQIAQAAAATRQDRETLNRLLSLWGDQTDWKVNASLPEVPSSLPSVANLEAIAVAQRDDLAASRADLEIALKEAGLEKKFRFIGGLGFGLAGEHDADGTNLNGPSVQFVLPVFNQGQAKVVRSQARLRQAQRRFEGLAIDIRSNVREYRDQLISEADMARYFRDQAVPDREKIVKLTMLNYNAMLTGAFDLFAARRDALEAERKLVETTRDYWIAHARLERAVGGDLQKKSTDATSSLTAK